MFLRLNTCTIHLKVKHCTLQNYPQYVTQAGCKLVSMRTVNHLIIHFAIAYKIDYNKHYNDVWYAIEFRFKLMH